MKSKSTVLWFLLAVALASAIWISDRYFQPATTGAKPLFAGLHADRVTGLQVIPGGALEISVLRTNHAWLMERPIRYPAQAAAMDGLLETLEKLTPVLYISASEMSGRKNAEAEFGFDHPQFTLDLATGDQTWHLVVGNKTAPGDGVYVRVVGATGAYVTDTAWLNFLPHDANDWRDTSLVEVPDTVDWLVITNGTQAIELRRDATNRLWRMVRPLTARANNLRIVAALQQLRAAKVSRFVTDDPKADLTTNGLESATLDVWLGSGTNLLTAVHAGKEVPGMAGEMFARREGWKAVVTTPKEPLALWRGTVNDFRDPNLLELAVTAPVEEIEVRGENNFTLQQAVIPGPWRAKNFPWTPTRLRPSSGRWRGLPSRILCRTCTTASGLQNYGLAQPVAADHVARRLSATPTASSPRLFSAGTTTNQVYVKRGDEDFVYALARDWDDLNVSVAARADYFRVHRIWSFSETNVAQVTLRQNGKTRQMIRTGTNEWSLAAGSQGIIIPAAVEETVHRLGDLTALAWIGRKFSDTDVGLGTNNLAVTVELKSGEKYSVDFGKEVLLPSLKTQTPLAVVTLDGERWAFIFPPVLAPLVGEALTIPADAP